MLTSIYVKNFILFDALTLSFENHMSAFIGETGAGKSLLIDAISLLMGERANASLVKQGRDKAVIEGVFRIDENQIAKTKLETDGYDLDEDLLVLTREITSDGKSVARINHRQTTVSYLKELGSYLLDIHSQHDTQYLLNSRYHGSLLDRYCGEHALLESVQCAYDVYKKAKDDLEIALRQDYNEDDLEFLQYQLQEIQDVQLQEEAIEALEHQQKQMLAFEKINGHLSASIESLDGTHAVMEQLYEACRQLDSLREFDDIAECADRLYDTYYNLEEQVQELKAIADRQEFDEQVFNDVQERLFIIHKIIRKYGGTVRQVQDKEQEIAARIEQITHRQEYLDKQEAVVKAAAAAYRKLADKLSVIRKQQAAELEAAIMEELADLHLPHAVFRVCFEEAFLRTGIDKVYFAVAMNAGAPLKPLQQVASGGELSRLMLGLKTIFTALQGIDTVIFDEIDTGVSGSVALAIGRKMQKLGLRTQVFCVTHLAQVAACADNQYLVEKSQNQESASTTIHRLEGEERIRQLALIATGSDSPSSLQAASELYQTAQAK